VSATDTKQRILDVAEQMFADHGFAGTSLRSIIAAAKVNLAAVHYHFKSKDALLEAVVLRRLGPLNEERLNLLNEYERNAGKVGPAVEEILNAFVTPAVALIHNTAEGCVFGKLLGRLHWETRPSFAMIARKQFNPIFQRFQTALSKALPGVPAEQLLWRMHFAVGAMAHTLTSSDTLEVVSQGLCRSSDSETAIPELIDFLSAGFRASSSSRKKRKPSEKRS
jgi:AcrR family transcriptional regulator